MKNSWITGFEQKIAAQKEQMPAREQRFFQVDRFSRMAGRISSYSDTCQACREKMNEMEEFAGKLSGMFMEAPEQKMRYDLLNDNLIKHLRNEHGIFLRGYFQAYYSVLGMITGTLAGGVLAYFMKIMEAGAGTGLPGKGLLLGWFLGLLAGQVTGKRKDRMLEKSNRIL